jgi:hypothetical protein
MTADAYVRYRGRRQPNVPWSAEQAARVVVSNLAALAGILATAYGASNADETQTTLLWLNLCVASLAFAGVSNALWLVRCHNTTSTRRADVLDEVVDTIRTPEVDDTTSTLEGYIVVTGLERFHLAGCAFAAGRDARSAADADMSRLIPCEVCIG